MSIYIYIHTFIYIYIYTYIYTYIYMYTIYIYKYLPKYTYIHIYILSYHYPHVCRFHPRYHLPQRIFCKMLLHPFRQKGVGLSSFSTPTGRWKREAYPTIKGTKMNKQLLTNPKSTNPTLNHVFWCFFGWWLRGKAWESGYSTVSSMLGIFCLSCWLCNSFWRPKGNHFWAAQPVSYDVNVL